DFRVALDSSRPAQLLSLVDPGFHDRIHVVWNGYQFKHADLLAHSARSGRRRIAALEPGRFARRISKRKTRRRSDGLRNRRAARACRWADTWRLHHRQLRLALGFLY